MTPNISSVPSGRMTGYALFSGRRTKRPALEIEALERELVVDDRDHDFAAPCTGALLDHDKIAVEHAGIDHRIALDSYQHRSRRMLDEIIVERQRVGGPVVDRVGQSRVHRRFGQRALKEAPRRRQAPIRRRFHEAGELESRDQRRDRRFGAQAEQARRWTNTTAAPGAPRSSPAAPPGRNDRSTYGIQ